MYNQSYEQYMQEVLGYNISNPMNTYARDNYSIYQNDMDILNNSFRNMYAEKSNQELENCYPEIYRIVYPMVRKACSQVAGSVTKEMIETMTNTIYMNLESEDGNGGAIKVNQNRNQEIKNSNVKEKETRAAINPILKDLIKIMLIRELLVGPRFPIQGSGFRPPFTPQPVSRPIMP